jgi:hypothetical protein
VRRKRQKEGKKNKKGIRKCARPGEGKCSVTGHAIWLDRAQ